MRPNAQARSILEHIYYATLATVDEQGNPWNSPVYFVFDKDYNLYWASSKTSQHSQNIYANGKVFIAIYDSTVRWGTGRGVFIRAIAMEVTDPQEITKACELRQVRVAEADQPPGDFRGARPRRIYRATPQQLWINQDSTVNGHFVDIRKEASARKSLN